MTERVDYDLLADFVGGALDGTPQANEVRRLVADDATWAEAYADLVAADSAVSAALDAYATRPEPMPADVVARLEALLRPTAVGAHAASGGPGRRSEAGTRPGHSGPGGSKHGSTRPGPAVRRRRVMAALSAVAAVIAVGAGLVTFVPLFTTKLGNGTTSSADRDAAGTAAAPQVDANTASTRQIASGRDYQAGQFGALAIGDSGARTFGSTSTQREGTKAEPSAAAAPSAEAGGGGLGIEQAEVPPELGRLVRSEARQACVDAIRSRHGGTVGLIDYARFAGRPALVVLVSGADTGGSRQWVVVVGPSCGTPAGFTDERYNGPAT